MDQHYHPLVAQRLKQIFESEDWEALVRFLESLSNAHFRTAGYMVGERFLPLLSAEKCWEVARMLMLWQPKAFVVTIGKALALRLKDNTLHIDDEGLQALCTALQGPQHLLDRQKLVHLFLPVIENPKELEKLFLMLSIEDEMQEIEALLHVETAAAGFVLFRLLRREEAQVTLLLQCCRMLMKRGDSLAFNMASLIRSYFDLQEIRGTFSLEVRPYEFSRLDTDFEVFKRLVMRG